NDGPHDAATGSPADFVVSGATGDPSCTATEVVPTGYTGSDGGTCTALLSAGGCTITNTRTALFSVSKAYVGTDGGAVTVSLVCGSGVVSPASASAATGSPAVFTVSGFSGTPSCTATES